MSDGVRHIAIYPGSFDPMTHGHLDVIRRGARLFDRLVVGVGRNPGKASLFTPDERVAMAKTLVAEIAEEERGRESAIEVRSFSGLTVDFAARIGATAILRGIRNLSDLQNEVQQAMTNREVAGLETVFVVAGPGFAYTSSSLIKQITALGQDLGVLSSMCPPLVVDRLREKKAAGSPLLDALRGNSGADED
ncbi:MAG: pantetheine-phosphate adenylyltransferase [Planctomycetota bacterium]|nr:pantetheine-phosphate adenylyltransferase [Planctomycetota bacterium]